MMTVRRYSLEERFVSFIKMFGDTWSDQWSDCSSLDVCIC